MDLNELLENFHNTRYVIGKTKPKLSDDRLLELYDPSKTLADNAKLLGIHSSSLKTRCCRLGIETNTKVVKRKGALSLRHMLRRVLGGGRRGEKIDKHTSVEDLIDYLETLPLVCSLTGLPLKIPKDSYSLRDLTLSVDRIDSSKPYTVDNVRLVHKTVNMFIGNIDDETLYWLSKAICNTLADKYEPLEKK